MLITDKAKRIVRNISLLIGSMVITFLLLFTLVIPIFNREYLLEPVKKTKTKPVGDWDNETEAYNYWYAPEGSFGIQSMRTVNWSFFKQKFTQHTDWVLQYKRYSYSEWTNGNQYLTVNKTWNETGFWKINLTFTAPVDVYEARFVFSCDLPVLQYVERDGWEVWLNYSFNATENISLMFNWSDLQQYEGLYFQKGVQNNRFYFLFGKQGIPAGTYVFDPTFGNQAQTSVNNIENYREGKWAETSVAGTADNITVYLQVDTVAKNVSCALYYYDDYSTNYAGSLIDYTEEKSILAVGGGWHTFNFSDPKPSLNASEKYYLTCWMDGGDGNGRIGNSVGTGYSIYEVHGYDYPNWEDPWDGQTPYAVNFSIYCSYTESAGEGWNVVGGAGGGAGLGKWNITLTNGTFKWEDHDISKFNTTLVNETWNWNKEITSYNTTLVNGTFFWDEHDITKYNTTLVNETWKWDNHDITKYNTTLVNGTFKWEEHNISNINTTLVNSSVAYTNIAKYNTTLVNGTFNWENHNIAKYNTTLVNLTWKWPDHNIAKYNVTLHNGTWKNNNISWWNTTLVNSSVDLMTITGIYPSNHSINIPLQPTMYLTINHTSGAAMNLHWYYGPSGNENILLGEDAGISNSTQNQLNWNASERVTDYYWRLQADDGTNYMNWTFDFKTEGHGGGSSNTPSYMIPLALSSFAFMFGLLFFIRYRRKKKYA